MQTLKVSLIPLIVHQHIPKTQNGIQCMSILEVTFGKTPLNHYVLLSHSIPIFVVSIVFIKLSFQVKEGNYKAYQQNNAYITAHMVK